MRAFLCLPLLAVTCFCLPCAAAPVVTNLASVPQTIDGNLISPLVAGSDGSFYAPFENIGELAKTISSVAAGTVSSGIVRLTPPAKGQSKWSLGAITLDDASILQNGYSAIAAGPGGVLYVGAEHPKCIAIGTLGAWPCGAIYELTPPPAANGAWHAVLIGNVTTNGTTPTITPPIGTMILANGALYFSDMESLHQMSLPASAGTAATDHILWSPPSVNGKISVIYGNLLSDGAGNFYGTWGALTQSTLTSPAAADLAGTVFEISPPQSAGGAWREQNLYTPGSAVDQQIPELSYGEIDGNGGFSALVAVSNGNIEPCAAPYCGTVQRLTPGATGASWSSTILAQFTNPSQGTAVSPALLTSANGGIYGVTLGTTALNVGVAAASTGCASGCASLFSLTPGKKAASGYTLSIIDSLPAAISPLGLTADGNNAALMATSYGGTTNFGELFKIAPIK
jgi:hypothetical protein